LGSLPVSMCESYDEELGELSLETDAKEPEPVVQTVAVARTRLKAVAYPPVQS
jgi:hypothetical protein